MHVDTSPIIYLVQDAAPWSPIVADMLAEFESGNLHGTSSFVTLLEVLVKPLKEGREDLIGAYREILLRARAFDLVPVDREVAESAARIRAEHGFRTPDAIQLASAVHVGCSDLRDQ